MSIDHNMHIPIKINDLLAKRWHVPYISYKKTLKDVRLCGWDKWTLQNVAQLQLSIKHLTCKCSKSFTPIQQILFTL